MNDKKLELSGMTIDCAKVRSVLDLATDELVWSGKVVLTFVDTIDNITTIIEANYHGDKLADFEGGPEDDSPFYEACEVYASDWASQIAKFLGRPSYAESIAA